MNPLIEQGPLPESTIADDIQFQPVDPIRLARIEDGCLLDLRTRRIFSALAELAALKTKTSVSLVTVVTKDRQVFLGQFGVPEPFQSQGETPLSHSFCQHVVASALPLVICDARKHEMLFDHPAVVAKAVVAYLGVPLTSSDGTVVGSLCVLSDTPREWCVDDLNALEALAVPVLEEFAENERSCREARESTLQLRQAQKLEAIGTLAGSVTHDFNNILMVIQSLTAMLVNEVDEKSAASEFVEEIQSTTQHAKSIVERLVTWNRQHQENKEIICVANAVRESEHLIEALMPTSVTTVFDISDDDCPVEIGKGQLTQILLNLCANSEHAMRSHGGRLNVSVSIKRESGTNVVRLVVADSGSGIPDEIKDRVLEPFFSTKKDGSGIGLSNVSAIVRSSGGTVSVDDNVTGGAVIAVELPFVEPVLLSPVHPEGLRDAGHRARILFVDDDPMITKSMCVQLERMDYVVTGLTDSRLALQRLKENPDDFDLLITDKSMPVMDGVSLAAEAHKVRPDLPVMMLTGFSHEVTEENACRFGISSFCSKPVTPKEVSVIIQKTLAELNR